MNKPSKCKNCQWYGKPYWSIINPCDSCPNENDYKTVIQIDGVPVIKETLTEEEIKKGMTDKSIFELTIEQKNKEIAQLNKIIDDIKSVIKEEKLWEYFDGDYDYPYIAVKDLVDKLKELKEEGKE